MEKFRAFWTALAAFLLTVLFCHWYAGNHAAADPKAFGVWTGEPKSQTFAGLSRNLTADSLPVFGSSEFQHGLQTPYHPAAVFEGTAFSPELIGAGYYQCLSHAVTLSAIEPYMTKRKAVLILSPQWFRKTGVVDQAYISRFSEILYHKMYVNPALSEETRSRITDRTHALLEADDSTLERILTFERVCRQGYKNPWDRLVNQTWERLLEEKDLVSTAIFQTLAGTGWPHPDASKTDGPGRTGEGSREPDWDALLQQAEAQGMEENTNPFFILDESYRRLEPYLPLKKNMNREALKGYQTGPEFEDLETFLLVCRDVEIEPMLVLLPVNGYYYDYTAFPVSARQAYYEKIRRIAEKYQVRVADFSSEEYTRYFFEDRVHIGKKGWVKVNEAIYGFGEEGLSEGA